MGYPPNTLPIRIGAIVQDGGEFCVGCAPDKHGTERHIQPRRRFTLLVYMPVIERVPPGMAYAMPFLGDLRTPPVPIDGMQTFDKGAEHFVRFINWN